MILSRREFKDAEFGVWVRLFALLHPKFRVFVERKGPGHLYDDGLLGPVRPLPVERSVLFITLEGSCMVRGTAGTHFLRRGDLLIERRNHGLQLRRMEERMETLLIEWEPGLLGTRLPSVAAPAALSEQALRALAFKVKSLVQSKDAVAAALHFADVLAQLRSEGLPFDALASGDLDVPLAPWVPPLVRSVDGLLSDLQARPMMVDLESALGWSPSTTKRRLVEFHKKFSFHAQGGMRELLRNWRLAMAASLMGAPLATTEAVAAKVGFSSPASFCEAFANAGLPSPGNVRSVLKRLA